MLPWEPHDHTPAFDDEAVDVTRHFTHLKLSLMPYLAGAAREAHGQGTPMARPMLLEFPGDRGTVGLDTQYMLGGSLLVAPVFSAEGRVEYYVPEGTWTHLLDGHQVTGPRWVSEEYGFESLPLLVRPGTVLPVGAQTTTPEYDWADGVTLRLFELPDGYDATTVVLAAQSVGGGDTEFRVVRDGAQVRVTSTSTRPWRVQVGERVVDSGPDGVVVEV